MIFVVFIDGKLEYCIDATQRDGSEKKMNRIGLINRMTSITKVSQVFTNNPQGSRLVERPKNRWWNCVQTDINDCTIKNGKERLKKTEHSRSSPFRSKYLH